MRKFPFTYLYGVTVHGAFCGPILVGRLSAPTQGLNFLGLLPLNYLIIFTLLRCNHCTVLEVAPKCAQISINGTIRSCSPRRNLRSHPGRWAVCTYSRFTFFSSLSPYLPYHIHPASVQPLYRARRSSKMCANFHSRTYTALQHLEHFAAPSRSVGFLHQLKVFIFWFYFPLTTSSYSPSFGATFVPY